jgi:hypothetical protein
MGQDKQCGLARSLRILALLLMGSTPVLAGYSPYADQEPITRVFWGDTHLHTSASTDAAARGNRLGLEQAYRFARGEEVTSSTGLQARLRTPLDFLVVADHSDGMGFFGMLQQGHPELMAHELGRRWHDLLAEGKGPVVAKEVVSAFAQGTIPWASNDPRLMTPVWNANIAAAERFNEPGRFTALIGYEWTSLVQGNNLHRVVILRDGADRAGKLLPYTLEDSADPEDLWAYLEKYEKTTGGAALAIPHNANLSNGMMFADTTLDGDPLDADYARRRSRWEPLIEISQIKGDGEAHPFLSPNDEFADYETWDVGNLDLSAAKTEAMLQYEYAREALKRGLAGDALLGANPFQFGIIASTDSHTSLSTAEENNFFGKQSGSEPSPDRFAKAHRQSEAGRIEGWEQVSSGYAAVWATGNTREALFDAMKRRETYGTTGSRITVRFFGGWGFQPSDAAAPDLAALGYAGGVPMGGELPSGNDTGTPRFLVAAQRDPAGANLDRIQIVKGWLDDRGATHEKVYDVIWAGERQPGADGRLPPVGNTVDLATATWQNSIGAPELATVWQDPDFDAKHRAFYYVRVLEIPTPRWTAYDAVRFGVEMPERVRQTTQERAYTSPIWYRP